MPPDAEGLVPVMAGDWGLSQLMPCSMTWLCFCKVESRVIYCLLVVQKKKLVRRKSFEGSGQSLEQQLWRKEENTVNGNTDLQAELRAS